MDRQSKNQIRAGMFIWNSGSSTMSLSDAVGFSVDEFERAQGELEFRIGDERGIVGLVAATGKSEYVPDCAADPRWVGMNPKIRSAYFLAARDPDGGARVVVLMSSSVDGIGPAQRMVADVLTRFLTWNQGPCRVEQRARQLEQSLARISLVLDGLGIGGESRRARLPEEVSRRIGTLSPREQDVFRRLVRGDRVSTISRELFISPYTVRNHLKAIFRKLDVRSQAELVELVRPGPEDD